MLLFSYSQHSRTNIFEKIYCDLWGLSLVYILKNLDIILVWLISFSKCGLFLFTTNLTFYAYLAFEKYATRQFDKKIKIFHLD